jgi:hypothetical protein
VFFSIRCFCYPLLPVFVWETLDQLILSEVQTSHKVRIHVYRNGRVKFCHHTVTWILFILNKDEYFLLCWKIKSAFIYQCSLCVIVSRSIYQV